MEYLRVIDLSGPNVVVGYTTDKEATPGVRVEVWHPFEVAFQGSSEDDIRPWFGDDIRALDANDPNVVKFTQLYKTLKEIEDREVLAYLFENFLRQLQKDDEGSTDAAGFSVVLPHGCPEDTKDAFRKAVGKVCRRRLKGFCHQAISTIVYYAYMHPARDELTEALSRSGSVGLAIADFRSDDVKILFALCSEDSEGRRFFLRDLVVRSEYDRKESIRWYDDRDDVPEKILVRAFGTDPDRAGKMEKTILEDFGVPPIIDLDETVVARGSWELFHDTARIFGDARAFFDYRYIVGLRLDEKRLFELMPSTADVPFETRRAFRARTPLASMGVSLYAGFSDRVRDATKLGTIRIERDAGYGSREEFAFIVGLSLRDRTHGSFSVIRSQDGVHTELFRLPALVG